MIVQGFGAFETTDGGSSWTPRNRGLRADWPLEHEEVGFCVHKLVMSPVDHERLYQQNHVGVHRSDDAGRSWTEITDGLPSEFGFAAAAHPHDRDGFYVVPLDGGHGRVMQEGRAAVWRTRDAGASWERLSRGLPVAQLDARWPGLRDRVCEPAGAGEDGGAALRPHIRVFVDGERAELDTPLATSARLDVIAAISGG